jgi:hypothetical protein
MISTTISDRLAGTIAREIDLHLRSDRSHAHAGDFARLLYQVTLRGPHESIFDHLLPRIRDEHKRATVSLFRRHIARLRRDSEDTDLDLPRIIDHFKTFAEDPDAFPTPHSDTLAKLSEILRTFTDLTQSTEAFWRALEEGRTIKLFETLDTLAAEDAHRAPLAPYKKRLTDLQYEVIHYLALPVGQFAERQSTLSKMMDAVAGIESSIRTHRGLQPPEQTMLIALFRRQQRLFDGTRRWLCDEPRKLKARNARFPFWLYFGDPRRVEKQVEALSIRERAVRTLLGDELTRDRPQIDSEAPMFSGQRAKFEEFFVDWMTSELDIDTLKQALRERWPPFFRGIYTVTTSFWLASLTMLAPFILVPWLDRRGHQEWEGIGFFVIAAGMLLAALFSFTPLIRLLGWRLRLKNRLGRLRLLLQRAVEPQRDNKNDLRALEPQPEEKNEPEPRGYWFACLLPRLARLTAVPMALIVEFDHSYEFPLQASSWSILLLASLSLLTTHFFVTREMVDPEEQSGIASDESKRRVWKIVAVALAHSFGIAVVLSAIFASSHHVKCEDDPKPPPAHTDLGEPTPFWTLVETVLERVDNVQPDDIRPGEKCPYPRFLGLVPRVVSVDIGKIAENLHHPLPVKVAEYAIFRFYPTIILVWTALGLFFGVFLEGFMNGRRLRGLTIDTPAAVNAPE